MGLFKRIKLLARLASTQGDESSRELGDLVEPGSTVDYAGMAALSSAGAAQTMITERRNIGKVLLLPS